MFDGRNLYDPADGPRRGPRALRDRPPLMATESHRATPARFADYRERVARTRVLVVGDVMLDRYWFGDVERISPEAPVPVVKIARTEERPGGAANVARNAAALGAHAHAACRSPAPTSPATTLERLLAADRVRTLVPSRSVASPRRSSCASSAASSSCCASTSRPRRRTRSSRASSPTTSGCSPTPTSSSCPTTARAASRTSRR